MITSTKITILLILYVGIGLGKIKVRENVYLSTTTVSEVNKMFSEKPMNSRVNSNSFTIKYKKTHPLYHIIIFV